MKEIMLQGIDLNLFLAKIGELIDHKITSLSQKKTTKVDSGYITRKEVAELLKITLPTLHEWSKLGWLQSYKIGNRVLYKQSEVEQALNKVGSFKFKKGGFSHA